MFSKLTVGCHRIRNTNINLLQTRMYFHIRLCYSLEFKINFYCLIWTSLSFKIKESLAIASTPRAKIIDQVWNLQKVR
jgi:hypothetical protein